MSKTSRQYKMLKIVLDEGEREEDSVVEDFSVTAAEIKIVD